MTNARVYFDKTRVPVLERFKLKTWKICNKKALEELDNGENDFVI